MTDTPRHQRDLFETLVAPKSIPSSSEAPMLELLKAPLTEALGAGAASPGIRTYAAPPWRWHSILAANLLHKWYPKHHETHPRRPRFTGVVWGGADSGPSRTVVPAHRGQHSGDCGQFLTSV